MDRLRSAARFFREVRDRMDIVIYDTGTAFSIQPIKLLWVILVIVWLVVFFFELALTDGESKTAQTVLSAYVILLLVGFVINGVRFEIKKTKSRRELEFRQEGTMVDVNDIPSGYRK